MTSLLPQVLDAIVSTTIALHPTTSWRLTALALHGITSLYTIFINGGTIPDYFIRTGVATKFFTACHLLWFTDPLNDYRHELDKVPARERSFLYRIYWAECLVNNARGIGSNRQIPYVPPPPVEQGWKFVKLRALRTLGFFLMVDVCQTYVFRNPVFAPGSASTCASPLTCQGYLLGLLNLLVFFYSSYAFLSFGYNLTSVIAVAFGISDARYWPACFGSLSEAYTVRRFWGRFWHQLMRFFLASAGKSVARSLGFGPGTTGSAYIQIYVAFTISGIIHAAGDIPLLEHIQHTSFTFFIMQAVAITFEDIIIAAAKKSGLAHTTYFNRLVGYSWVGLWFTFWMHYIMRWSINNRFTVHWFPFSPAELALTVVEKHYGINMTSFLFN